MGFPLVSHVLLGLDPGLHRRQADGLKLRGHVLNFSTPAVRDIGGASLCIRLEASAGPDVNQRHVALREGGYLLALRGADSGNFLPAIAGVPCRQGLDRAGLSRVGLAECMVLARQGALCILVLCGRSTCARIGMDSPWVPIAASFVVGWLSREWTFPAAKEEPQVCKCHCNCQTNQVHEGSWAPTSGWILFLGCLIAVVVFGNTALALKISYRDSVTGTDKEVSVDVKGTGKSKGVYGSAKGLQITY
eukprot:s3161_g10.t1